MLTTYLPSLRRTSRVIEAFVLRHQSTVFESNGAARLGAETAAAVVHELLLELGRAHRVRRRGQITAGARCQIRRVGHRVGQHLVGRRQRRVVHQPGDQLLRGRRRNRVWNVVRARTLLQHPIALWGIEKNAVSWVCPHWTRDQDYPTTNHHGTYEK